MVNHGALLWHQTWITRESNPNDTEWHIVNNAALIWDVMDPSMTQSLSDAKRGT
jgi:hypothetical protein